MVEENNLLNSQGENKDQLKSTGNGNFTNFFRLKLTFAKQFFAPFFLKGRAPYIWAAVLVLTVSAILLYQFVILKKEISEFSLIPQQADAAGIQPGSGFILESTKDLSSSVIKEYLKFSPSIEYAIDRVDGNSFRYSIQPETELAANAVYSISIEEGDIAARDYGWAYQVKAPFQIVSSLPRHQAVSVPTNTGIEITFNRELIKDPEKHIKFAPEISGTFSVRRDTVVFVPSQKLMENSIYTITVSSNLIAEGSEDALEQDEIITFETTTDSGVARPYFGFDKRFWEFSPGSEAAFEVNHRNLSESAVSLWVYKFDSVEEFLNEYRKTRDPDFFWSNYHSYQPVTPSQDKRIFAAEVPLETHGNTRFIRAPQQFSEGQYLADVLINGEHKQAWFQVTPVASFTAVSGDQSLLWLKNLSSNDNISNAAVTFAGAEIGKTNSDGVAIFNTPQDLTRGDDWYYSSNPAEAFFTVNVGSSHLAVPVENQYGYFTNVSKPDEWWDYLSVDKSVYLPTDIVRFWGIVKQRNDSELRGQKLTMRLTDPYWYGDNDAAVYGETEVTISDFYSVTGEIPLSGVRPGLYQLSIVRGNEVVISENVNVETYTKPAYRLLLEADKNAVFAGEAITYSVQAEFFEGTPVPNMNLKYQGYFQSSISGEIRLDENGRGKFSITPAYSEGTYDYWPKYFAMTVFPAIAEEGEINASVSTLVFGPHYYLDVDQSFSESETDFELSVRNIELANIKAGEPYWRTDSYLGNPAGGVSLTTEVVEITYNKTEIERRYDPINKVTYPIYQYSRQEKSVHTGTITTASNGSANFRWSPEPGKTYKIVFTGRDNQGRKVQRERYAYGGSFSYFGTYDTEGVSVKDLKGQSEYSIGDPIQLQLQDNGGIPIDSSGKNIVFVKTHNGKLSYTQLESSNYEDVFEEGDVPNVGFTGVWFGGTRFHNSYPINISFKNDDRRLSIDLSMDKQRYRPGDTVTLDILVRDSQGRPKEAEVNVAAIDEAIFTIRPAEQDVITGLYKNVYSTLVTRSSHITPFEDEAERGGCFLAGTEVLTPAGLRPIEDLRSGDRIITRKNEYSDKLVEGTVSATGRYITEGYLVINNTLRLTKNHTLLVNDTWTKAGQVVVGDTLLTSEGKIKVETVSDKKEWRYVYNIEIDEYHTFFADNIYVHNEEKGGGSAREDFRDNAIYRSVVTNNNGQAQVTFEVPDNITSWRVTTQAVSKDLYAGKTIGFVPVGLPFFVDASLNRTYLNNDQLILRARVFGTENFGNSITYTVESETLPIGKIEQNGGRIIEISLGNLSTGEHSIVLSAKAGNFKDTIVRTIMVEDSYYSVDTDKFYELTPELSLEGDSSGFTTLSFSNYERGRFYSTLRSLACCHGIRIDQKFAGQLASIYLNRYFSQQSADKEIDVRDYQLDDGSIALLPYSGKDLLLSAKVANLVVDEEIGYDRAGLISYLRYSLQDKASDVHRAATALYGLSAFKEPVLVTIQNLLDEGELTLLEKTYLALALDNLGAKELAREYYAEEIVTSLKNSSPYVYVDKLQSEDENLIATVLLAGLAESVSLDEAAGLGNYALEVYPKETLKNFELLLYLKRALPKLKEGTVSFAYHAGAKNGTKTLGHGEVFQLKLSPEELSSASFTDIDGRVGVVSSFRQKKNPESLPTDASLNITRKYYVNGKETAQLTEGDLVKIELIPSFGPGSLPGTYQMVDYLPSGLRAVTNRQRIPFEPGSNYHTYPSQIEDQRISFVVWKEYPTSFYYYARVISKGQYTAEPAIIQSLKSLERSNISGQTSITIQ